MRSLYDAGQWHRIGPLDDGSKMILNTASTVQVALTERRRIGLDAGEVFFKVRIVAVRGGGGGERRVIAVGVLRAPGGI